VEEDLVASGALSVRTVVAVVSAGALIGGASAGCSAYGGGGPAGAGAASVAGHRQQGSAPRHHGQGIGDPYYPDDGNRGYDVKRYHVRLRYFRPTQRIAATTTIASRATARLPRFNLDLLGMTITKVTVDGKPARHRRAAAHELVIRPARPVAAGHRFLTKVTYHGKPGVDPVDAIRSGWYDSDATPGAGFVAGEPHSCTLWYPCNDHPTDKAKFSVTATVPRPLSVISNGRQLATTAQVRHGTPVRTFRWRLDEPTATYLTTIYIDKLTFERSRLADGTRVVSAYGPNPGNAPSQEAKLPAILRVLARWWGPYPAPEAGGIFVSAKVPFSIETFTRPLYFEGADASTIAHENAHQWWGDNISVKRWRDVCLNECLASYSQWLWQEHLGADLDAQYRSGVAGRPSWLKAPLYDMGAGHEFDFQGVYLKGAFFVHALRNKIGDKAFFRAMQAIQRQRGGGNMSMLDLRDALEHKTGVDLTSFWNDWVLHARVPSHANLYPGNL
jgi:aminopeptidase N